MMDLPRKYQKLILKVLSENLTSFDAYIFGSRAKGGAMKYSDVDLLIDCGKDKIPFETYLKIKRELNDSDIPYLIDVSDYNRLDPEFKKIVDSQKIKLVD